MRRATSHFGFKLSLSFFLVLLVALGVVYFSVNRSTHREFRSYVIRGRTQRAAGLRDLLVDYYRKRQSWSGVGDFLDEPSDRGRGSGRGLGLSRLTITSPSGEVRYSTAGYPIGKRLSERILDKGIRLTLYDEPVGILLAGPSRSAGLEDAEKAFLQSVNRALLFGGLFGLLAAVILGFVLILFLTKPLDALTEATERITSGNLDQEIELNSGGQLEELGEAFNRMASSLKRSEELRQRMIADIAHELRTPITVIKGGLESLQAGVHQPTEERLGEIQEDVALLERLVEDLHDLSLADAGELPLEKQSAEIRPLLERIEKGMQSDLARQNIQLNMVVPEELPSAFIDPARIEQVLVNLLQNSARFTPRGGEITISVEREGDEILISVSDTGEGIPAEKIDKIFDRFYRGEASRPRSGGSGLGLSIAKELVEAHGGAIWAGSPGQDSGAQVTFSIPISSH